MKAAKFIVYEQFPLYSICVSIKVSLKVESIVSHLITAGSYGLHMMVLPTPSYLANHVTTCMFIPQSHDLVNCLNLSSIEDHRGLYHHSINMLILIFLLQTQSFSPLSSMVVELYINIELLTIGYQHINYWLSTCQLLVINMLTIGYQHGYIKYQQ